MRQGHLFMWKTSLGGPVSWMRWSWDIQGGANSVSQVDGVSDMAPAWRLRGSVWMVVVSLIP